MIHRPLTPIVAGTVSAPVLALDAPISFWGGIDNLTGRIIDRNHPQAGEETTGCCLVVPAMRGSGGTPGSLAMLIKLSKSPAGIVIGYPDINVITGAMVAEKLYGKVCPIFLSTKSQMSFLARFANVEIDADGTCNRSVMASQQP